MTLPEMHERLSRRPNYHASAATSQFKARKSQVGLSSRRDSHWRYSYDSAQSRESRVKTNSDQDEKDASGGEAGEGEVHIKIIQCE